MKGRESGMPEEAMWADFFDPPRILELLGLGTEIRDIVEFGCGYGTFTLPAARMIQGTVHALDIEAEMLEATRIKAAAAGLKNVQLHQRDFIANGCGLAAESIDYAMLFNILHVENPVALLHEAKRILAPGGRAGIIHWNHDPATPRGPSMAIRPRPAQCIEWVLCSGLELPKPSIIDLPPYHYGLVALRPS
ncbi:MAG: class I SAM-dependent methyltransferase [Candidatus Hydrogenedentes bacterium]|nr:class I SAM-dependent methyltransferase [Candidatus Hydrogenedentota bacterium]